MLFEILHPKQYSDFIEEKICTMCQWYMDENPQVMISDKRAFSYQNFYNLFFSIFSESNLQNDFEFEDYKIYLINHSKNESTIILPQSKSPKIIYFANNSNAKLKLKNETFSLIDKKGKSIFIDSLKEISLIRSTNVQTCIVVLNLIKDCKSITYN